MQETKVTVAEAMEDDDEEEGYVQVGTRFYRVTMRPTGGGGAVARRRSLHYLKSCYLCKESIACDRDVFMYNNHRSMPCITMQWFQTLQSRFWDSTELVRITAKFVHFASSKPGKDVPVNISDGSGLQSPSADEDITSKAMRRAAIRNLDCPSEKKSAAAQSVVPHSVSSPLIPQPDYLFGYPLATYLGYYAEAGFAGYSCSGIATIDAGGQGIFLPGTWVAV